MMSKKQFFCLTFRAGFHYRALPFQLKAVFISITLREVKL